MIKQGILKKTRYLTSARTLRTPACRLYSTKTIIADIVVEAQKEDKIKQLEQYHCQEIIQEVCKTDHIGAFYHTVKHLSPQKQEQILNSIEKAIQSVQYQIDMPMLMTEAGSTGVFFVVVGLILPFFNIFDSSVFVVYFGCLCFLMATCYFYEAMYKPKEHARLKQLNRVKETAHLAVAKPIKE
jgi:hypothetical protein